MSRSEGSDPRIKTYHVAADSLDFTRARSIIISNPVISGDFRIEDGEPPYRWLPFQPTTKPYYAKRRNDGPASVLRSLSQTCRALRASTLPLLWSAVHVATVDETARLREILKISPSLAQHVRSFSFFWTMNGEAYDYQRNRPGDYAPKELTLLDLAFRDRPGMYNALRTKLGCESKCEEDIYGEFGLYFEHNGVKYQAPGKYFLPLDQRGKSDPTFIQVGSGPDGDGLDQLLIKSPEELVACLTEVVGQLRSLQTLGWSSPVLPMPLEVFNAVKTLAPLTSLHLDLSSCRTNVHSCEYCSKYSGPL